MYLKPKCAGERIFSLFVAAVLLFAVSACSDLLIAPKKDIIGRWN